MTMSAQKKALLESIRDEWQEIVCYGAAKRTLWSLKRDGLIELDDGADKLVSARRAPTPPVVTDAERIEAFRACFSYDPASGLLSRISGRALGPVNPVISSTGYLMVSCYLLRKDFRAHRICWELFYGMPTPEQIDHINGDRLDNRIENLRAATGATNSMNRRSNYGLHRPKGVVAVQRLNAPDKYEARIGENKKHLGTFNTKDEAAHAYNKAAIRSYGEFACLNPVGVEP